ncbi:hypothetical protein FD733_01895 [Pantoea sp. Eser]|nr:hypothetical protein [Pantoea sp. Eser]
MALIEDVILPMEAELSNMLDAHQQTLTLDLPEDVFVRGDATLLKMLLRNLVENAHSYSPKNSAITLRLASGEQPALWFEDEGPGIDESKSGELSKAFIRMDSRYGGIGLGLSIVSRIVQLHRFQFFLENRRDRSGCRAVIKF